MSDTRQITEALTNGETVTVKAESQADATNLYNEVVQALYQVNHLWTDTAEEHNKYTATTSSGGQLIITVSPEPLPKPKRAKA